MNLIGYKHFYSKGKEQDYFVANCTYPFAENDGVGTEVYGQFIDKPLYELLKPEHIGHEIDFVRVSQGRYTKIVGVTIDGKVLK